MGSSLTSADSVTAARPALQQAGGGATPTPALHSLRVLLVAGSMVRPLIVRHHYLHAWPAGTRLCFGVFLDKRLVGAMILGTASRFGHRLVGNVGPRDCLALTRLWLADDLPPNSESRVISVALRAMKRHTSIKFVISYADPSQGHLGTIYQATNWLYTGLSSSMPLYDLGDGKARHTRSVANAYGTHSVKHFADHGIKVKLVPQATKHRYIYFLDPGWRQRLCVPVLPYPKGDAPCGGG